MGQQERRVLAQMEVVGEKIEAQQAAEPLALRLAAMDRLAAAVVVETDRISLEEQAAAAAAVAMAKSCGPQLLAGQLLARVAAEAVPVLQQRKMELVGQVEP